MRLTFRPLTIAAALFAVAAARPARGADDVVAAPATLPTFPAADFAKDTWAFTVYGGYDRECSTDPQLGYVAVGASYFVADDLSVSAEARTYYVRQKEGEDAALFELDLMIRHHILRYQDWSLFIEAGAGVTQATRAVPYGGTHFNFMEEAGVGATYKVADGVHLIGGVRYWHISNAQIEGEDRNPALNGYGAYFGVMFRL